MTTSTRRRAALEWATTVLLQNFAWWAAETFNEQGRRELISLLLDLYPELPQREAHRIYFDMIACADDPVVASQVIASRAWIRAHVLPTRRATREATGPYAYKHSVERWCVRLSFRAYVTAASFLIAASLEGISVHRTRGGSYRFGFRTAHRREDPHGEHGWLKAVDAMGEARDRQWTLNLDLRELLASARAASVNAMPPTEMRVSK